MEEISLRELFYIIRKWIALIIAIFVISVAVAGGISYYILKPEYKAFTTLMVGKANDEMLDGNTIEYNDLVLNQKLVTTYGKIIESRRVADKVIEKMKLDLSYENFIGKVNVTLVSGTEIIKLEVSDQDPTLAAEIANETALIFMDTIKDILFIENIQIIDGAQVPKNKTSPRPALNMAIAGVLGLMIGVFLVFLLEYLDNTLKTEEDVERHLELPVIGAIHIIEDLETNLVTQKNPKSPIAEAFRTLRTNIQFSNIDKEMKTLVVTSSTLKEGKSTITANLAATIAENDKSVLLIDCDLRKPRVHKNFEISNLNGLTNIIMGDKKLSDIVYKYPEFDKFHILTSGPIPPNPAELLGSKKMKKFLEGAKEEYDLIILDSPPIGLVTDSAVLSTIAEGVLLVGAVAEVEIELIKRSKDLLDRVNANIIGVVLNKIPISGRSYYKYSYYQHDGYYDQESLEKNGKS